MIDRNKARSCVFYFCLWLLFFSLSCFIVNYADDFVYKASIERYGSFIGWADFFANNWGGRVIPQGLLVLLLQCPEVAFHITNATFWILLMIYVCKVFDFSSVFNRRAEIVVLTISIFALIPAGVLGNSIFWKSATVSYLWGVATALIVLYPFVCAMNGKEYRLLDFIFATFACVYASGFEQVAIFMAVAATILLIFTSLKTRKLDFRIAGLAVCSWILTLYFYKLPGNDVRYTAEVLGWFQKFDMFSLTDKCLLGIKYALYNSESQVSILFLIMSLCVLFSVHKFRKQNRLFTALALCLVAYFTLCWIVQTGKSLTGIENNLPSKFFRFINVDTSSFTFSKKVAVLETLNITMVTLLGGMLVMIVPQKFNALAFTSYFGGLATMAAMGFSPTIYASGLRPVFLGCFLLLFTAMNVVSEIVAETRRLPFSEKLDLEEG